MQRAVLTDVVGASAEGDLSDREDPTHCRFVALPDVDGHRPNGERGDSGIVLGVPERLCRRPPQIIDPLTILSGVGISADRHPSAVGLTIGVDVHRRVELESLDPLLVAVDQEPEGACLVHFQQCQWAGSWPVPDVSTTNRPSSRASRSSETFTVMFIVGSIVVPVPGKSLGVGVLLMASVLPGADAPQTGLPWAHDD